MTTATLSATTTRLYRALIDDMSASHAIDDTSASRAHRGALHRLAHRLVIFVFFAVRNGTGGI